MKRLALFDLDDTLVAGDSDYLWGQFLIEQGVVDRDEYEAKNREFNDRYRAGTLNLDDYLGFQLLPLAHFDRAQLDAWHVQFLASKIVPIIRPGASALIARYADAVQVVITATNRFVTGPISRMLGIPNLLATELEEIDGRFTGRARGTPCFKEGKITRLEEWLAGRGETLADYDESAFYSDSINDLPLLLRVTHPFAAHPDDRLRREAVERHWPIVSLD
jgi:HAD superfamily hydrolase (TIGR01490 family)